MGHTWSYMGHIRIALCVGQQVWPIFNLVELCMILRVMHGTSSIMQRNSKLNNENNCEHNYVAIYLIRVIPAGLWKYIAGIDNTYTYVTYSYVLFIWLSSSFTAVLFCVGRSNETTVNAFYNVSRKSVFHFIYCTR